MMDKLPCEMAVWDSVPAIRAALAAEMVSLGLSQKMVAQMLGMAQSAVSQYLSGKRGYRIEFSDDVRHAVADLAEDMKNGKVTDPGSRICKICVLIRQVPSGCEACDSGLKG
jgi:uncharacterized protein